MDKLPFFEVVDQKLKNIHQNFDDLSRDYKNFIKLLLDEEHFDFANKPKGYCLFTPIKLLWLHNREQLYECSH
jgi:hypothetical protein